jgi:vacuolar protein sorting-associated protein 53
MISSCFDSYLWLWVKKEDHAMRDAFEKLMKEETWTVESDEGNRVLTSSMDLVFYFKNQLRLGASISRGKPLVDLAHAFVRVLRSYCERLVRRLPVGEDVLKGSNNDVSVKMSETDAIRVCLIVNTAEYMAEVHSAPVPPSLLSPLTLDLNRRVLACKIQ